VLELQEEVKWLESGDHWDRIIDVGLDVERPILTSMPCFGVRARMALRKPRGCQTTHDVGEAHGVWMPNINGGDQTITGEDLVSSTASISFDAGKLMEAVNKLRCGDGLYWFDKSPFYSCFMVTSVWIHEEVRGMDVGHRLLRDLVAPFVLQGDSMLALYPWPAETPEVDSTQNRLDSVGKLRRHWSEFGLKPLVVGSDYYGFNTALPWPKDSYMGKHGLDGRK